MLKQLLAASVVILASYIPASGISSGTYSIGTGGDFPDLATAVADLNGSTLTGPVTFNIIGSHSGAGWQAELTNISGASATNRITIQRHPLSTPVYLTVAGTTAKNYVIRLNNASFITIKDITFFNTEGGATGPGRIIDIAGNSSSDSIVNCRLNAASGTATGNERAAILMGTLADPLTGTKNVIKDNTITNGYCGIYLYGTSATNTTDDHIISNNTINEPYTYGIYTFHAGGLVIKGNKISGTGAELTHGIYNQYNQNGGEISNNEVDINTTTGTHYGIFNDYHNSSTPSAAAKMANNKVTVAVTKGTVQALYNRYAINLEISDNTFTGTAADEGKALPPNLMYYCTSSGAWNNTFTTSVTTGALAETDYFFMSYANNCRVVGNIFNFSSTTGSQFTVSTHYTWMDYSVNSNCDSNVFNFTSTKGAIGKTSTTNTPRQGLSYAKGSTFCKNTINYTTEYDGSTQIYSGGFWGYYPCYDAAECRVDSNNFNFNFNGSHTITAFGYYFFSNSSTGIGANSFSYNNIKVLAPKGGTIYSFPYCVMYNNMPNGKVNNNTVTVEQASGTSYLCGYYGVYSSENSEFNNNTFTVVNSKSAVNLNYAGLYSSNKSIAKNNTWDINTTGTLTFNGGGSVQSNSVFEDNIFNLKYGSCTFYLNNSLQGIMQHNTYDFTGGNTDINITSSSSGEFSSNTINVNSTGTINNYDRTPSGILVANNKFTLKNTTGVINNLRLQHGSASNTSTYLNNIFDLQSNSGTVYGCTSSANPGKLTLMGNIISIKTSGDAYMFSTTHGYLGEQVIVNNTFHSNATGAVNQFIRQSGGAEAQPGKAFFYNNIFSRSNASAQNSIDIADTAYLVSDYNLYYSPGDIITTASYPQITTTSLAAWRAGTGEDRNSLIHDPGYMDAANGDYRPDPANPNSWAAHGRGIHIPNDTMDVMGNPRPRTRSEGVPDLGAYEFVPTSTPPNVTAQPAVPVANSIQTFLMGQDTVCSIEWGNTIPSTIAVKQYTGVKADVVPAIAERAFCYVDIQTSTGIYEYTPKIKYKDPWLGDVSYETNVRLARSSNGGAWMGYNYHNGITDSVFNSLMPAQMQDSLGAKFTAIENGRVGIRCLVLPTGLHHFDILADKAKESWEPIFVPTGFQAIVDSVSDPLDLSKIRFISQPASGLPTYAMDNLAENTMYYVSVRAVCGPKDTSAWAIDSFRTMITCHAPNIKSTSITDRSAVVYWDTVKTGEAYEYAWGTTQGTPAFGTKIPQSSIQPGALQPGTTYYVYVRSHCSTIYDLSGWAEHQFTTTNTSVEQLDGAAVMNIYPNPVKDKLNIRMLNVPGSNAAITITDVTGKVIYNAAVKTSQVQVNMQHMPAGLYMLKYTDDERTASIKVSKE